GHELLVNLDGFAAKITPPVRTGDFISPASGPDWSCRAHDYLHALIRVYFMRSDSATEVALPEGHTFLGQPRPAPQDPAAGQIVRLAEEPVDNHIDPPAIRWIAYLAEIHSNIIHRAADGRRRKLGTNGQVRQEPGIADVDHFFTQFQKRDS